MIHIKRMDEMTNYPNMEVGMIERIENPSFSDLEQPGALFTTRERFVRKTLSCGTYLVLKSKDCGFINFTVTPVPIYVGVQPEIWSYNGKLRAVYLNTGMYYYSFPRSNDGGYKIKDVYRTGFDLSAIRTCDDLKAIFDEYNLYELNKQ